ncbi:ANTAR domain-containing protein [Rhodococcus sp. NPDC059968]|uniref:ANTAR domain-containing protein n=1 Tax=Rhodococcus sp. NPDC059968 TaxID=3347017 RepID=UPI0036717CC9
MPTDTSAVSGRDPSETAGAQLLSAAAAILAEQLGCSQDAAFDSLLDVARRKHVSIVTAAEHILSRPSTIPDLREQPEPRPTVHLPRAAPTDMGGVR